VHGLPAGNDASISITCQRVFESIQFVDVDKTAWPSNVNIASSFGYIRSTLITRVAAPCSSNPYRILRIVSEPLSTFGMVLNYLFIARGLLLRFFVPSQSCRGPQVPVCLPREPRGMTGKFQHEGRSFQKPTSFEVLNAH
jgi:hypothetical protein